MRGRPAFPDLHLTRIRQVPFAPPDRAWYNPPQSRPEEGACEQTWTPEAEYIRDRLCGAGGHHSVEHGTEPGAGIPARPRAYGNTNPNLDAAATAHDDAHTVRVGMGAGPASFSSSLDRQLMSVSRPRLVLSLGIGMLAISSASILIRFAQAEAPTLTIAAWRLTVASLVLVPYAWLTCRGELRRLSRVEWHYLAASGIFLGLHFAAWISSLGYTSVASSVVLVSMGPLFVGLGSWIFMRERLSRGTVLGIALAAIGSVLVGWSDLSAGQGQLGGDLLALAGAVMVAGYLMIGRKVRAQLSLTAYIAPVYGVAMVCLWVLVGVARPQVVGFGATTYGWMIALGLVPQLVGHSTLNWALAHLSATFVSLITLTEPIGSGILAYLILGEVVTLLAAAGGALILTGIYIASRAEARLFKLPSLEEVTP